MDSRPLSKTESQLEIYKELEKYLKMTNSELMEDPLDFLGKTGAYSQSYAKLSNFC